MLFQKSCKRSSYFSLPKELRNPAKKLINFQNGDFECFRWCLVRQLNPENKISAKIRNIDREFENHLNFRGIKFPFYKKDYAKIEKQNNISNSVFGYEDRTSYRIYTSKQTFKRHIDYYHRILNIFIMFSLKILIDL